jgi:hypothetical protein
MKHAHLAVAILFFVQLAEKPDPTVFVNAGAQVYHQSQTCALLRSGHGRMQLSAAIHRGFVECNFCRPTPGSQHQVPDKAAVQRKLDAVIAAMQYLQSQVSELKALVEASAAPVSIAPAATVPTEASTPASQSIQMLGVQTTRSGQAVAAPDTRVRCQAITKKGTQCSRMASPGSRYCWQHQR